MEIDKDLSNILKLVENNLIVKVVGTKGLGKTTNLPKYLGKKYKTIVIVSEKNVANSLNSLKFPNVLYVSSAEYRKKDFGIFDLLIIDEIDTGSFDNFLIMSLWKKSSKNIKLILTSNSIHNLFKDFPTYIIEKYFDNSIEIRYMKDTKNFDEEINELINLIYRSHHSTITGDFLIFTLGKKSIDKVISKIKSLNMEVDIFSLAVLKSEMFQKGERRKIFVTSDSGKTAITLKNIGCIFDNMREKRNIITLTGGSRKKVKYISKRDANLRARRGNKNCIIYRMISEKTFNDLPEITEEVLFRIPLHHLIIDIYEEKLNPFEILFDFDKTELNEIFKLFIKYGLLDVSKKLTNKARLLRKLNLGIKPSLLILELSEIDEKLRYPAIVLASLIDNYPEIPLFLFTKGIDKSKPLFEYALNYDEHIKKHFNRFRGRSDFETLLYIWETYMEEGKDLKNWCDENFIDYTYIKNVNESINKIKKFYNFNIQNFNVEEFIAKADETIQIIYTNQKFLLNFKQTIFANYYDLKGNSYKIDSFSINLIEERRPKDVYAIIISTIPNSNTSSIYLSYVSPLTEYQYFNEDNKLF